MAASRRRISGIVSGIFPGSGGGAWSGTTGAGAWVSVQFPSWAAVTAQIARAAMTSTMWRRIAAYSLAWHSSRPRQSLPGPEILFHRPSQPGGPDQAGLGQQLALGDVAVMKGQLTGFQVASTRRR